MDPEERIRRREERRRRREAEKAALEQETKESNFRSSREEAARTSHDYEQTTPTLEPEKSTGPDSEQVPTEEAVFVNDDDSRCNGDNEEHDNENVEQQKEDYTSMNGPESDAEESTPSVTEENREPTENKVKVGKLSKVSPPKPSPSQNSSQTEPEALNVYKEMKMKKEQDESTKTALLELRFEQTQIYEEIEALKRRKAERARQWEEADRIQQQHAEDRRRRQQEEEQKLKQEFEKQKKEREIRMQKMAHNPYAYQAPKVTNGQATLKFGIRKAEAQEREKKNVLSERVPPLDFGPNPTKDRLRQLAQELVEKLTTAYGKFFDLEYQTERSKYTIHELKTRIKAMNKYSYERQAKVSAGGLSNIVKQLEQAQDGLPKSRLEREKQAGSILSSGGVKARLSMFGGGSLNQSNNNTEEKQLIDLTK